MAYLAGMTIELGLDGFRWNRTGTPITSGTPIDVRVINDVGVVVDTQTITATDGVWSVVFDLPDASGSYTVTAETVQDGATWRGVTQLLVDPFP